MMRWPFCLSTILAFGLLTGCNTDQGPPRYRISGDVTFQGQPIPFGDVVFTPDSAKGNSGPQGIAMIKDGKFDSTTTDGLGIAGGPTVIRVTGAGAANATNVLCEYEYRLDLPKADSTLKIEVPASASKKATPEI